MWEVAKWWLNYNPGRLFMEWMTTGPGAAVIGILVSWIKWLVDPVKLVAVGRDLASYLVQAITDVVPVPLANALLEFVRLLEGQVMADGISIGLWGLNQICDARLVVMAVTLNLTLLPVWFSIKTALYIKGHFWPSSG